MIQKFKRGLLLKNNQKDTFYKLLEKTPIEYFEIAEVICKKANKEFKGGVSSQFVMLLADHISFAIKRSKENVEVPNLLLSETQSLYPKEYKIGVWALRYIHARFGISLPETEAGFIAIHLININHSSRDAYAVLDFCKSLMTIIEKTLGRKLDILKFKDKRLFMHLKYLAQRIFMEEDYIEEGSIDTEYMNIVLTQCPKIEDCLEKIKKMVQTKYNYHLTDNELFYIMIHLNKLFE